MIFGVGAGGGVMFGIRVRVGIGVDFVFEPVEGGGGELGACCEGLAFDVLGHYRGGGYADGAAAAAEFDVADCLIFDVKSNFNLIAALRVAAAFDDTGVLHRFINSIAWVFIMV